MRGAIYFQKDSASTVALAHTLGTTVEVLLAEFKTSRGEISLVRLMESETYKNRILSGPEYGRCENTFVVDNGDGRIGNGDLFLHADGYYQEKGEVAFRYRLFGARSPLSVLENGVEASENGPNVLSADAYIVFGVIQQQKGQKFSKGTITSALTMVCRN